MIAHRAALRVLPVAIDGIAIARAQGVSISALPFLRLHLTLGGLQQFDDAEVGKAASQAHAATAETLQSLNKANWLWKAKAHDAYEALSRQIADGKASKSARRKEEYYWKRSAHGNRSICAAFSAVKTLHELYRLSVLSGNPTPKEFERECIRVSLRAIRPSEGRDAGRSIDAFKCWEQAFRDAAHFSTEGKVGFGPLWPLPPVPARLRLLNEKVRSHWSSDPSMWSFWQSWWDGLQSGESLDWEVQKRVILIPDDLWQLGAANDGGVADRLL